MTTPNAPATPPDGNLDAHITAHDIATHHGADIHTVRNLFRTGQIPGTKIGAHGWTTTHRAYTDWHTRAVTNLLDGRTLTTDQIATNLGVHRVTARRYFTRHGAPGIRIKTPFDRTAVYRARPHEFAAWLRDNRLPPYGSGPRAPRDDDAQPTPATTP